MKYLILLILFCSPAFGETLIIGDSVSLGYTPYVSNASHSGYCPYLRDKTTSANNDGNSKRLAACINLLLNRGHYSIVHFNAGMHDVHTGCKKGNPEHQVELSDYLMNLQTIIDAIRSHGAIPVFATTTPVEGIVSCHDDADIVLYNESAVTLMRSQGIRIDPLYSTMYPIQHGLHKGIHFTSAGYKTLADEVVKTLTQVKDSEDK